MMTRSGPLPRRRPSWSSNDWATGIAVGRGSTAAHVERIVRAWRWRAVDRKAELRETAERHRARALHVYQDEDGWSSADGWSPEAGAVLMQALAAESCRRARRADTVRRRR
jgi:hypothetical protein